MALTPFQTLQAIAPEIACHDGIMPILSIASKRTSENVFGDQHGYAVALLAAHIVTLRERAGLGQITSEKEGDLAVTYAQMGVMDGDLNTTGFGQMLAGLRKECTFAPMTRMT